MHVLPSVHTLAKWTSLQGEWQRPPLSQLPLEVPSSHHKQQKEQKVKIATAWKA